MKKRNLVPLAVFCIIFLAYSLYFVKVINTTTHIEPNSIAKTIRRVINSSKSNEASEQNEDSNQVIFEAPITQYVNYRWLNIRENPSLASKVLEKVYEDAPLLVYGYSSESWALVESKDGSKGYVARRYLRKSPPQVISTPPPKAEIVAVPEEKPPVNVPPTTGPSSLPDLINIPVITYHHISDQTELYPPSMVLPDVNFFAQLDYLIAHGFQTITFQDLKAIKEGMMSYPEKAVILTFNGGYSDAYLASQHLNGKGLKGVFYISTEKIGAEGYLDWRQMKKMRSWGMEIGSMGVTGANLLSSTDFYVRDEIFRSKDILDEELGEPIVSFAYANGAYNNTIEAIVEEAGYVFARSSNDGSQYSSEQFYELPALRVFFPAGARQFQVWLGQ